MTRCASRSGRFAGRPSNPFSTRYVMPGSLAWLSPEVTTVQALADSFRNQLQRRAALVGPHGSGKSTLLAHLLPLLGEIGWYQAADSHGSYVRPHSSGTVVWQVVRRGQRPLQQILCSLKAWNKNSILVVDGWEQLRGWEAVWIRSRLWKTRMGLLVTCHRPRFSLPTLYDTTPEVDTVQRLVTERLTHADSIPVVVRKQLAAATLIERLLLEEQGSVREVFMRLYDLVENYYRSSGMFPAEIGSVTKISHQAGSAGLVD
jgi:energy-coupling factor transporter ATP-binding protein EcfA2